tara:strand:- start:8461 stop:9294 length:834 start_codon:yes stop_codon:yes gene_type:complete
MSPRVNLVFGGSGLIGKNLKTVNQNNKNFIYISSSKNKKGFFKFNLNRNFKYFPYKNIDNCFFLASPRILKKNFSKQKFYQEYKWLKKVIYNLDINKIIYLSSSSVYYSKNHLIGSNKRKCENLVIENKNKFKNYQIWRPFNLIGNSYEQSDHFHNILFKVMFIKNKKYNLFNGNINDKRGYSNVNDFVKVLLNYSKKNKSFVKDFGNQKLCKIGDLVKLYNKYYFKLFKKNFKCEFVSKTPNINKIEINNNNIYRNFDSLKIINLYLKNSLNVKKV